MEQQNQTQPTQAGPGPVQTSPAIAQLAAALAKAQAELSNVGKDREVKAGPIHYRYATLAAVLDEVRPALAKHGLAVTQIPSVEGAKVTVVTLLLHASGEWIRGELTLAAADPSPQRLGSAMTYARRYALSAMTGIAPDDDDDAQAAQGKDALAQRLDQADAQRRNGGGGQPTNAKLTADLGAAFDAAKTVDEVAVVAKRVSAAKPQLTPAELAALAARMRAAESRLGAAK